MVVAPYSDRADFKFVERTVKLPEEVDAQLTAFASRFGMSVEDILRIAASWYMHEKSH